jgi:hypothetical protein
VARDRDVVLAVFDGGEPKVAAGLTGYRQESGIAPKPFTLRAAR